jgi:hypothetical protein
MQVQQKTGVTLTLITLTELNCRTLILFITLGFFFVIEML